METHYGDTVSRLETGDRTEVKSSLRIHVMAILFCIAQKVRIDTDNVLM